MAHVPTAEQYETWFRNQVEPVVAKVARGEARLTPHAEVFANLKRHARDKKAQAEPREFRYGKVAR